MKNNREKPNLLVAIVLALGVVSLFIKFSRLQTTVVRYLTNTIDYIILLLFILEVMSGIIRSSRKIDYFQQHIPEVVFIGVFLIHFLFRRKLSLERTLIASYVLDEKDVTSLHGALRSILSYTLIIEFIGFLLLIIAFSRVYGFGKESIFVSLFRSVSAFCNAGFALVTDNLAAFRGNLLVNGIIAVIEGRGTVHIHAEKKKEKRYMTEYLIPFYTGRCYSRSSLTSGCRGKVWETADMQCTMKKEMRYETITIHRFSDPRCSAV